jgi:hypothetical protein
VSPTNDRSIQKNIVAIKEDEESELKSENALDDYEQNSSPINFD